MIDPGKVQGAKLLELFKQIVEKRTIISMAVVGTDYERLTCVIDVIEEPGGNFVVIDLPKGFQQAAQRSETLNLRFNFNGPDQLEYLFGTQGGTPCDKGLKIPFPDYVERLQRRKNFRILTPPDTRMYFRSKTLHVTLNLINVSLGGALGILKEHNQEGELKEPFLRRDQRIYRATLVFPANDAQEPQHVAISKAEVRRIEADKERSLYRYAFEFTDIDREETRKLTQAIYHIQRQYLQRR